MITSSLTGGGVVDLGDTITLSIATGGVTNAKLADSSVTIAVLAHSLPEEGW